MMKTLMMSVCAWVPRYTACWDELDVRASAPRDGAVPAVP
jgi:hypothetical protein